MQQKSNPPKSIHSQSSLPNFHKLQRKISLHLKRQRTLDITFDAEKTKISAQKIPQKFIVKNKLLCSEKKVQSNKKFEWLTKSIENSRKSNNLSSLLSQKSSIRQSFSNLKKFRDKTDFIIPNTKSQQKNGTLLSGWTQNKKSTMNERSMFETLQDSSMQEPRLQTGQQSKLIGQQNSIELLKEINVNKKIMIKSQSFELKQFRKKTDKQNEFHSKQNKQNFKKVLSIENRTNSLMKRKKFLQSQNRNDRDLQQKQKSSKFLVSGFNPKDSNEEMNFFKTPQDTRTICEIPQQERKCIKNLKKKYICLSKESRKQQSQYLKRNRKNDEEIKVQPWNYLQEETQQDYEVIRFH